ncbi:aspartyl/asparaginyl beta-hydroxylase domain-containing protein [Burkholderia gladioli]|uniref:aspartyl/asparaginyl beta-hydroxylase domain-containing protein n=1 Tax=Burkholderia gladioli TaxID=28095 RepID=UPI00163F2AA1|nr:aspartyl/asparaginyl beta-hydroxylase domain-containing protein [Burkholderia gladioli]MBJ9659862.1 aspartyl/asparaginyl beta-hydroxylase domain-containing protein [Burkholderia gladioli]
MRNFQKIAEGANVVPLLNALYRKPELWLADDFLRKFPQGPFGETDTVYLRFQDHVPVETEADLELYQQNRLAGHDLHECPWRPEIDALPEARAHIMALVTALGATRLGRCMINRVKAGGRIFPHADSHWHASYWDRYHLVLQSEPGNVFRCGEEQVWMRQGEIWWFQNAIEHEVTNNSADDRIHLIMDLRFA